jgi:hypothetical protein
MRIGAFVEEKEVVEMMLRHLDLWKDHKPHPPPKPPPNLQNYAKSALFFLEVPGISNSEGGKWGDKVSLGKDAISSCPPASEKRKTLSTSTN